MSAGEISTRFIGRRLVTPRFSLTTERHSNGDVILNVWPPEGRPVTFLPSQIDTLIELIQIARGQVD